MGLSEQDQYPLLQAESLKLALLDFFVEPLAPLLLGGQTQLAHPQQSVLLWILALVLLCPSAVGWHICLFARQC